MFKQAIFVLLILQTISARSVYYGLNRNNVSPQVIKYISENQAYKDSDLQKEWQNRFKREVSVNENSDGYEINAEGDIIKDEEHSLTGSGVISGLKNGEYGYKSADANIKYSNDKGYSADITAHKTPDFGSISARGKVPLLNNDKHNFDLSAYINKEFTKTDQSKNYGGSLDYAHKNGHSASLSFDHDSKVGDTLAAKGKASLLDTDVHKLDASGYYTKETLLNPYEFETHAYGAGLDYSHRNGHSASLSADHISNLKDEISAAGKLNLYRDDKHNLDVQGTFTKTFPYSDKIPDYNSYGGSVDYMYKNKVGASVGFDHSDLFDKTDYSAAGKLNIFRDKDSSFDFSAGLTKSVSPFERYNTDWSPSVGLAFRRKF